MTRDSHSQEESTDGWASRRKVLKAASVGAIAGLAGCQRDTDDQAGSGNGTGNSNSNALDPELTLDSLGEPADDVQWNEFNFASYKWMVQAHVMDPFGVYDPVKGEFVGLLADDWTVDTENQVLELKLNQNYEWHDGEETIRPVTAEDVRVHFMMEQYMGFSSSEYIDEIEAVDEYTVKFQLKGGHENEDYILFSFLTNVLSHGMEEYQEWLGRFEGAENEDEQDGIASELAEHSISSEDMESYGPFAVKEASREELVTVKNEGHPVADEINFPNMVFQYFGSEQKIYQSLANGPLDGHVRLNVPSDVVSGFPDHVENTTYPSLGGLALKFRWDDDALGDPRVRQAIAYVIDQETVAVNAGNETHDPVFYQTGMSPSRMWDYLDDKGPFPEYRKNHNRATQLLQEAGFSKEGDQWYRPDGEEFGPTIKSGTTGGSDLIALETITSQLQQFGISSQLQTSEATSFESDVWEPGDFRIATGAFTADFPQPYAWYNLVFLEDRENVGMPSEISVPPVGRPDGNENALTIDLDEAVVNLTRYEGNELQRIVRELAWASSYAMPQVQVYENRTQTWFTNDEWEYPSLDSDVMQRQFYTPFHYIVKTGQFKAKTK
ncbi:ABC transporter substrate-binding protein [Halegenticoccus tardaugens]|uniref:ABC transporter substrate-binding protein n=1 Tax=Halegenticoccus tardaugens TaxID=2071624 RepID=UPI00100A349D|nr:ABC transporter substrate-binding protein [Halegenticoccus tardaugens]